METSFQEFLKQKAETFGRPDRLASRSEWIESLRQLYDQIVGWLREADHERLLEFEFVRDLEFDPSLGTFDAPVLNIRLGEALIRVRPMGRRVIGSTQAELGPHRRIEGRVDLEERHGKAILYRVVSDSGEEEWCVAGEFGGLTTLDRNSLESILRDLWS